jgi:hypothetical protein
VASQPRIEAEEGLEPGVLDEVVGAVLVDHEAARERADEVPVREQRVERDGVRVAIHEGPSPTESPPRRFGFAGGIVPEESGAVSRAGAERSGEERRGEERSGETRH